MAEHLLILNHLFLVSGSVLSQWSSFYFFSFLLPRYMRAQKAKEKFKEQGKIFHPCFSLDLDYLVWLFF